MIMDNATLWGFFDEVEKIAAKKKEEKDVPYSARNKLMDTGAGLAASTGVNAVSQAGQQAMGQSLARDVARSGLATTQAEADQLRKAMGVKSQARVLGAPHGVETAMHMPKGGILPRSMRDAERKAYTMRGLPSDVVEEGFKSGLSVAPASAGGHIMAHELGHAKLRQGRLGKIIGKARAPAGMLAPTATIAALASDPDSTVSKATPYMGAAAVLPTLADEGYASLKGYKTMKNMGTYSKPALKSARRQLWKAFGTYGLGAAPLVAAPIAIRKAKKWRKNKALEQQRLLGG